jgi:hypothetical protein
MLSQLKVIDGLRILGSMKLELLYDEEHCMKTRIENWIIDGLGDCPLELARSVPKPGSQTIQLLAGWKGDYSWRCHWPDGHLGFSAVEWVKSKGRKWK